MLLPVCKMQRRGLKYNYLLIREDYGDVVDVHAMIHGSVHRLKALYAPSLHLVGILLSAYFSDITDLLLSREIRKIRD